MSHAAPRERKLAALSILTGGLFRNAGLLLLNYGLVSALGFVFWLVAARLFRPSDVGAVSALVSSLTLVGAAASLGLQNFVVRYHATHPKAKRMLTRTYSAVAGASLLIALVIAIIPGSLGIPLASLGTSRYIAGILYGGLLLALAVGTIADSAAVAQRRASIIVAKNVCSSALRTALLPVAAIFGSWALFLCIVIATSLATLSSIFMTRKIRQLPSNASPPLPPPGSVARFIASNYVATLISLVPTALLPIVVLHRSGAREAAFLSMPLLIIAALSSVASTTSQSMFAELSAGRAPVHEVVRGALRWCYTLLIPAVIVAMISAPWVLRLFGPAYASAGATCLRVMALGTIFGAFNYIGDVVLNVAGRNGWYAAVNVGGTVAIIIALGVAILSDGGLTAIGVAWTVGQAAYGCLAAIALWSTRARGGSPIVMRQRQSQKALGP